MLEPTVEFFLGSNTKNGFVPLFDQVRNPKRGNRLYILKGGAGSGKSTLMRRIGKALEQRGDFVEYIPCASDPDSLDAIIDVEAGIAMVDGTPPHVVEGQFPGAYERIVNAGDAWNEEILQQSKEEIMNLCQRIEWCHTDATSHIAAAACLLESVQKAATPWVDYEEIAALAQSHIPVILGKNRGKESKRLLSAVSVGQVVFYEQTLTAMCDTVYVIKDPYGAASNHLLELLRQGMLNSGNPVISCYCSINTPKKLEHLILPNQSIAFTTQNEFHAPSQIKTKQLPLLYRNLNQERCSQWDEMIATAKKLITTASNRVAKAKNIHDDLEHIYISAMDFSKIDALYEGILAEICP